MASNPKELTWDELIQQCYIHQSHPVIKPDKLLADVRVLERALEEPNLGKRAKLVKRAARQLAEYVIDIEMYYRRYYSATIPNTLRPILIEIIERCSYTGESPANAPGVPKTDK